MSVKQRIKEFVEYKKISERQFCLSIEVSPAYISAMRTSIQPDKVLKIASRYPELNVGWLMTGEGSMIKATIKNYEVSEDPSMLEDPHYAKDCRAVEKIAAVAYEQQKTISDLMSAIERRNEIIDEMRIQKRIDNDTISKLQALIQKSHNEIDKLNELLRSRKIKSE